MADKLLERKNQINGGWRMKEIKTPKKPMIIYVLIAVLVLMIFNTIISPMEEIKQRFRNAIALVFINKYQSNSETGLKEIKEDASPYELFNLFFTEQNGREMSKEEDDYIKSIIGTLKEGE